MARIGFCGGSYTLQNPNADAQRTVNWYPSPVESGQGKSAMTLDPCPGLKLFCALPGMTNAGRGSMEFQGRYFKVAEGGGIQKLFELSSAGAVLNTYTLGVGGQQASLAANNAVPAQMLIASGGQVFLLNLVANTIQTIDTSGGPAIQGPVSQVGFCDGYFIALLANSNKWQISNLLDGATWQPSQITGIEIFPDNIVGFIVDHDELIFFGPKRSVVYYNSGNFPFPFDVNPAGKMENGLAAAFSPFRMDNSFFWLDQDERGQGIARRSNGYTPVRVSTFAEEFAWAQYPTISDCVTYSYQEQGHTFGVFRFPSANNFSGATWVYDVASGMWHERTSNQGHTAHKSQDHALVFGKHLVGDWQSGNVYEMAIPSRLGTAWQFADEAGQPILRERRVPAVSDEFRRMYFANLYLDLETGLGPQPPLLDGAGIARGPYIWLDWSNDGAHTWSNAFIRDCGQAGEFLTRVYWNRLGSALISRVFRVQCSDPIPWRIVDGYIEGTGFMRPTERLVKQFAKMA